VYKISQPKRKAGAALNPIVAGGASDGDSGVISKLVSSGVVFRTAARGEYDLTSSPTHPRKRA